MAMTELPSHANIPQGWEHVYKGDTNSQADVASFMLLTGEISHVIMPKTNEISAETAESTQQRIPTGVIQQHHDDHVIFRLNESST